MSLFAESETPHVYALPPGCDFAAEFVHGLLRRQAGCPPETLARAEIFLSTGRLRRNVRRTLLKNPPILLPKLRLVTELASDFRFHDIARPVPPLRRRLELFQAVSKLLEGDARFGAGTTVFGLADSLATLMDEMHAEGVHPRQLLELDVSQHSAHWRQSLVFLNIIAEFWQRIDEPDDQARQRMVVERLIRTWRTEPPSHPVIVAGSTGSRGATRLLMKAVAALPQGAVVFPCYDFEMPADVWDRMRDAQAVEDHPQFRFKVFFDEAGIDSTRMRAWNREAWTSPERNRLISLALRPAPVTDQWLAEGPGLAGVAEATRNITLVEAPSPRAEAISIALRLRQAVENGESAALVTPNRVLARQVKAALARWDMRLDDPVGGPLVESVPGKLLGQTASLLGQEVQPVELIALLRHSLVHSAVEQEQHRARVDRLETHLRKAFQRDPLDQSLESEFPDNSPDDPGAGAWRSWLQGLLRDLSSLSPGRLDEIVPAHRGIIEALVRGSCPHAEGTGGLWRDEAGQCAHAALADLQSEGPAGGILDISAYRHIFTWLTRNRNVLVSEDTDLSEISLWSTLEARMQSPDVIIASGLDDNMWPSPAPLDPWLNRDLRRQAGLLMPERVTGLAAHDFMQAVSGRNVVLTRCLRDADSSNVPSRWLIRLTNLLAGIGGEGSQALADMRRRGQELLDLATALERPAEPVARAGRPAPKPALRHRPKRLSVTSISKLITNPYEIYARDILRLREMLPIRMPGTAPTRGTALHAVMDRFMRLAAEQPDAFTEEKLLETAANTLVGVNAPEYAKQLWLAQLQGIAQQFISEEWERSRIAKPLEGEVKGEFHIEELDFTLSAVADRVDRDGAGNLVVYDYKTGTLPGPAAIKRHDKQIPLTAIMLEKGGFEAIPAGPVKSAAYIRIGKETGMREVDRTKLGDAGEDFFAATWTGLLALITAYNDPDTAYAARRDMRPIRFESPYDHLARYGEWDESDPEKKVEDSAL
ncbi:MAG: double-strand break repair protein AddB [Rhodobacteraceae bacterium]|nr:double-strand break repair protein AddB [Paracoccaceae bacterium]